MKKLGDSIESIIEANPMIKIGLCHRWINISRLAAFLRPLIEAETKKDVQSDCAIVMALSRYQNSLGNELQRPEEYRINHLGVQSGLLILSYVRTEKRLERLADLYALARDKNSYAVSSQSTNEITLIIEARIEKEVKSLMGQNLINRQEKISALGIKFDEEFYDQPGLLYYLIMMISLPGINICEISSTYTEIIMYVKEENVRRAFDIVHKYFYEN